MAILVNYWHENETKRLSRRKIHMVDKRRGVPSPVSPALRPGRSVGGRASGGAGGDVTSISRSIPGRRDAEWGGRGIGESSTWVK